MLLSGYCKIDAKQRVTETIRERSGIQGREADQAEMGKGTYPKGGPDTTRRLQDVLRVATVGGPLRSMARRETFLDVAISTTRLH